MGKNVARTFTAGAGAHAKTGPRPQASGPLEYDVVIVGGGLIGLSLALLLHQQGFKAILLENKLFQTDDASHLDARSLALSSASVAILKTMGLWGAIALKACPIDTIHVSNQGRFGSMVFNRPETHPLGYVVELAQLQQVLLAAVPDNIVMMPAEFIAMSDDKAQVTFECNHYTQTINTKLIVAADGAYSRVRKSLNINPLVKDYHQSALIANVALKRSHQHQAYERFTRQGPLAMLPLNDKRMALVWAMNTENIDAMMALDDKSLLQQLQRALGHRLGQFDALGARQVFPLKQTIMSQTVCHNVVFIGNAAQSLHPIAGQGFNLGLRDVATLIECLNTNGATIAALEAYQQLRKPDTTLIARFTDGLISLFTSRFPGVQWASGFGLSLMDNSDNLQAMLARMASGYAGQVPYLACGEAQ